MNETGIICATVIVVALIALKAFIIKSLLG